MKNTPDVTDHRFQAQLKVLRTKIDTFIRLHGPNVAAERECFEQVLDIFARKAPWEMVVLSTDIRKSTRMMGEAIDFIVFGELLTEYVSTSAELIRDNGGFFDKFTGDGYIAYWMTTPSCTFDKMFDEIVPFIVASKKYFREDLMPKIRRNSFNVPDGAGLSFGLDCGPVYFTNVGKDISILGKPVVGAVRMVQAASPYEVVINRGYGDRLIAAGLIKNGLELKLASRKTKEYPEGQEMYLLDGI